MQNFNFSARRDTGLERFIPKSLLRAMKGKELRRILANYIKTSYSLAPPGDSQLNERQAQLHYLKLLGGLRALGAKSFVATLVVS